MVILLISKLKIKKGKKKEKINFNNYSNEKEYDLKDYFQNWITWINKKTIIELLKNILLLKKKKKEYDEYSNKNKIVVALVKKKQEMETYNKKRNELLMNIIKINNKHNLDIIKKYFNKWKAEVPKNDTNKINKTKNNNSKINSKEKDDILIKNKIEKTNYANINSTYKNKLCHYLFA